MKREFNCEMQDDGYGLINWKLFGDTTNSRFAVFGDMGHYKEKKK